MDHTPGKSGEFGMSIDSAYDALKKLKDDVTKLGDTIVTEQDARLKIINRMLIEVLGWHEKDIRTEPHSPSGYTDYLLFVDGVPRFVVEAKRTESVLIDTLSSKAGAYKVGGPALTSAVAGIRQAASYCLDHGPDFATLTTGVAWIAFQPFPRGFRSYRDAKAIAFPNLEEVEANFAQFHDLFSYQGVSSDLYKLHFTKAEGLTEKTFETFAKVNQKSELRLIPKSELAADTDPIFREFFGELSGDTDEDMLTHCFVESRESKQADSAIQKIIASISANVSTISNNQNNPLANQISASVETGRGESVLIVGNKGAGKSTFTRRFFKSILGPDVREKCLVLHIELKEATGEIPDLHRWLNDKLRSAIERALYSGKSPTYDELRGMYWREYQEWRSIYEPLYQTNRAEFKNKFSDYLKLKITDDRHTHVLRLLEDAVNNRKLLPCLIFDNADHHDETFQQAVFQWSQSLRQEIDYTFVVMPITDRTIWRLSKFGPFQTYKSKIFYLPVPSAREVLEKRIDYLKGKSLRTATHNKYFLKKGIRLSLENIRAFAACVEEVFIKEDFVSRRLSWLANHDIRRSLILAQNVITSPFMSIDDLVAAYLKRSNKDTLKISYRKLMQSIILGDYNQFQQDNNSFIVNLFEVYREVPTSPLLMVSMLRMLVDKAGQDDLGGYMSTNQILAYCGLLGCTDDAVISTIKRLLEYRLIEPFDASATEIDKDQRYAITHSGRMHIEMAMTDPIYISQMAYDTPLTNRATIDRIRSLKASSLTTAGWEEVRSAFMSYCLAEDAEHIRIPVDSMFDEQRQLRVDLRTKWVEPDVSTRRQDAEQIQPPEALNSKFAGKSELTATVKWFDEQRGYGFATGENGEDVFLDKRILQRAGLDHVAEGQTLRGDAGPGLKGRLQFTFIYSTRDVTPETGSDSFYDGIVTFYDEVKKFGFLHVPSIDEDVYFSGKVLTRAGLNSIASGAKVKTKISTTRIKGRFNALHFLEASSNAPRLAKTEIE